VATTSLRYAKRTTTEQKHTPTKKKIVLHIFAENKNLLITTQPRHLEEEMQVRQLQPESAYRSGELKVSRAGWLVATSLRYDEQKTRTEEKNI
jgi:hypothetical protein